MKNDLVRPRALRHIVTVKSFLPDRVVFHPMESSGFSEWAGAWTAGILYPDGRPAVSATSECWSGKLVGRDPPRDANAEDEEPVRCCELKGDVTGALAFFKHTCDVCKTHGIRIDVSQRPRLFAVDPDKTGQWQRGGVKTDSPFPKPPK